MTKHFFDAAIIGAGAAGLTAAVVLGNAGAKVIVAEAERAFGGTSAIGGGNLWIPNNPIMTRDGRSDSLPEAFAYLRKVSGETPSESNVRAFLEHGPRLIEFLENHTELRFASIDRPDYHPQWYGAASGRSLEPLPFEASMLGSDAHLFRTNLSRAPVTYVEARAVVAPDLISARRAKDVRTQGAALIAGLGHGCLAVGVRLECNARVVSVKRCSHRFELRLADDLIINAGAIVIASGGFGLNPTLRRAFLPSVEFLSLSAGRANGDGMGFGLDLGGALSGLGHAWLGAAHFPGGNISPCMVVRELALPGSILINETGQRFVNESMGYNDVGSAMLSFDVVEAGYPCARAWLVFDDKFRSKYTVLGNAPSMPPPTHWFRAADLNQLADLISTPGAALAESVKKMNSYAVGGVDFEFGRGGDAHQRFNGDETQGPNPCLGKLESPPFYAVPIRPGICSTKGGLAVNEYGQIIGRNGEMISNLFACGDVAESIMGYGYAGAGASIGPAMTFAMLSAKAILANVK